MNIETLYADGTTDTNAFAAETLSTGVIDIERIKDEVARTAELFEEHTNKLMLARLAEMRAEHSYETAKLHADLEIRRGYELAGIKKPAEDAIKNEVRMHPTVVAAGNALASAAEVSMLAKYRVESLARRDGAARTIASLIKAELNALD